MNNLLTTTIELEIKKLEILSELYDRQIMRGRTEYRPFWREIENKIAEGYAILAANKYERQTN